LTTVILALKKKVDLSGFLNVGHK